MDKDNDTRLTLRLPADVAEGIKKLAEQEQRSLNGEIVFALREYLASKKKKEKV